MPATINLQHLHDVVQIVMGWFDMHMFEFEIGKTFFVNEPENFGQFTELRAKRYKLNEVVEKFGTKKFTYTYDFGDRWEHTLTIENTNYKPDDELAYGAYCLEGQQACPVEDTGGIMGYMDMLEVLKNPDHDEYESFMEYCPDDFDPNKFDIDFVNDKLKSLRLRKPK